LDDYVTNIYADAELNAAFWRHISIACLHALLDRDCATDSIHGTGKFHQYAVTSGIGDPAAVLANEFVDQFIPMSLKGRQCAFFIGADKARISSDVSCNDCRQSALSSFCHGPECSGPSLGNLCGL
jgi:hypothetical protein